MNATAIKTMLAPVIGFLAAWLAKHVPFIDAATWSSFIDAFFLFVTSGVMAYFNRNNAIIAQAVALPEVKTIVAAPETARAITSPDVVSSSDVKVVDK